MRRIRYTKYTGELAGDMDFEDLMQQLSEYLLDSGFQDPLSRFQEMNGEHTLENLREALRQALPPTVAERSLACPGRRRCCRQQQRAIVGSAAVPMIGQ